MSNLKYTETHEWLETGQDELTIGITEHAQELLGDMVFVDLPETGDEVNAGDELGVLESVKAASDFYAPVSGTVSAVNEMVREDPSLVNSAPLSDGWLVKIKPSNPAEIESLLDEAQYKNVISEEH
jgi:glycine cleavage system H protein